MTKSPPCLGGSRETATDKAQEGSKMDSTFNSVEIAADIRYQFTLVIQYHLCKYIPVLYKGLSRKTP